jgi:hypothetical protein
MGISGIFYARREPARETVNGVREDSREARGPRRLRPAYALAAAWVVAAFVLYAFQLLNLVGALG